MNWMDEYLVFLKKLDNNELFQEFKDMLIPDGEDNYHTPEGNWKK